MIVELTDCEVALIHDWYDVAAGESSLPVSTPEENAQLKALLGKFGFAPHYMDEEALAAVPE